MPTEGNAACIQSGRKKIDPESLGGFDTILLLGHNLGIGGSPEGVRELLRRFQSLTHKGARLLVCSIGLPMLDHVWVQRQLEYNRVRGQHPGPACLRMVFRDIYSEWYDWIHVSPDGLDARAFECGWRVNFISRR